MSASHSMMFRARSTEAMDSARASSTGSCAVSVVLVT
jgi:hypothetical protein